MFRSFGWMFCGAFCLVGLLASIALGQELPAPDAEGLHTSWTLEKIEKPAERRIKFVVSDKPAPIRLKRVEPALLSQKFAAKVQLPMRSVGPLSDSGPADPTMKDLRPLFWWPTGDYYASFYPPLNPNYGQHGSAKTLAGTFELLVKQIPADQRPTEQQLDFFLHTKLEDGYLQIDSQPVNQDEIAVMHNLTILAPTAELAQERTSTFLKLLDWGLSRPLQLAKWKMRTDALAQYSKAVARIEETKAEFAKLQREYEGLKEFTDDLRPGVKVQLAQADADLADATARSEECEKLLADAKLDPAILPNLRARRVDLQIEIKGLTARRETLAKYLDNIAAAHRLRASLAEARVAEQRAPSRPRLLVGSAETATYMVDVLAIRLAEDTVQIQPLKWEP